VRADPGQLEQVIMNLAVNARDAMSEGGTITIETRNIDLDDRFARSHAGSRPGPHVMLVVRDTGCGMDAETQSRIFEPFFTTKEKGKGTGLGLSTVYGIVKQSGGYIWVDSAPGRGATFTIYLPRVEQAAESPAAPSSAAAGAPRRGTETVLLVEDEDVVRQLTQDILKMHGYTVLASADGDAALALLARHAGDIHLMLTDVVMPRMNGRELYERAAPLRASMRVLYMSGYTDGMFLQQGALEPGTAFIQKPFTPDALAAKVRQVLDARTG
jgi:CheY-like chemotaxis protein